MRSGGTERPTSNDTTRRPIVQQAQSWCVSLGFHPQALSVPVLLRHRIQG